MENETESASSSALAWLWTIEALASLEEVKPSLLHDVIDQALELPEDKRKDAGEMVALKCLECLFGPLNYIGENGSPAQESKVTFDSSESCEHVVKRVCKETLKSALRVAGPDMSKWDVSPFIAQKRASMRCTLDQLRDSILDGTHPHADFLMQKSGLTPINKGDSISMDNEDGIEFSRRLDGGASDPQSSKGKGEGSLLLLEDERRISVVNPSSSSLLTSKRSAVEFTSEDEAIELPGCDDGYINVKKLKQHSGHTSFSRKEVDSSHETEVLEDSPDRIMPQNERDDTDHLDEHQMTLVEDKVVEEEHYGLKKSGQCAASDEFHQDESGTPYTMLDPEQDGDMHGVIRVEKEKDGSGLLKHQKTSYNSLAEGNQHDTITDDPECDFGDDNHVNEMNTMSHSGFLPKNFGQCTATDELHRRESGTPYSMLDCTQDGEMHDVISVERAKNGSELLNEQKPSEDSPGEGNRHDIITEDPELDFGDDNHVNEMNTTSHGGFLQKTVAIDIDVGMNLDEEEKDMLSDSDGYHNERIDIAMKKNEFFSSQCMVDHDSFLLADRRELNVCVKCNEGNELLSCKISDCPLVIHAKCLGSSCWMSDEGDFCCPFCVYSRAISDYLEAKKHAALAKKNVSTFIRTALGHQSIVIKEVLQENDLAGFEDVTKICDHVNSENEDNQVTLDGEHVNEVVNHPSSTVSDIVRLIEDASSSRVAPAVLSVEEHCDDLVDHERQGNTVAELENQKCQGNITELEDGEKATEQYDNNDILHEDQSPVEAPAMQEGLQYRTDDSEEEPAYPINIEGEKSSDDDNDETIISRYSIRFRRKYHHMRPETHPLRQKKLPWTAEEEETLREGVRQFSSSVKRSPIIAWKKILEFGSNVFLENRTSLDLKNKWRNLCRSPEMKLRW